MGGLRNCCLGAYHGQTVTRAASPDGTGEYVRARIGKPSERPKLGTLRRANAASAKLSCADNGSQLFAQLPAYLAGADRMGAGLADTAVTGQRLVGGGVEMRRLLSADAFSVSTTHAGATIVPKARWCWRGTPRSPRADSICSSGARRKLVARVSRVPIWELPIEPTGREG